MFLSCVIVARNEEKNIDRCIKSVLNCTKDIKDTEILLVDSCSTDKTLEIAKRYPVSIITLNPAWQLSPAAGRFSGVNNTTGEYILIIDGDMELLEGWLTPALKFMEEHPKAAVVVGQHFDIFQNNGSPSAPQIRRSCSKLNELQEIDYVFGSSVFRRKSLLEAGNFHPYLRAEEEAEISHRLKITGYKLFFLPYKTVYHYCISHHTFQYTLRRVRHKLWAGIGDMFSWCLQNRYYSIVWKRFWEYILFSAFMILNITGTVCCAVLNERIFSLTGAAMPLMFILLMCIKKRSISQGLLSTVNYFLISFNLTSALFRKMKDISCYPTDVSWFRS